MRRWRGLKALVHDAVDRTADLVEEANGSVARDVLRYVSLVEPLAGPAEVVEAVRGAVTGGVVATVKAVNRAVEVATDAGLDLAADRTPPGGDAPVPLRSDVTRSARWLGDAALGAVNAAVGDYLDARGNGLALGMTLRAGDRYLAGDLAGLADALPDAKPRAVVFVHGLGTTEWSWFVGAEAHWGDAAESLGTRLARELDVTALYLRYNTGRHVSENGRDLAALLEALADRYPAPLVEIVLVGHSMGGLVLRSACHYGRAANHRWTGLVRRAFCLGSPHRGAPLEKLGHVAAAVLQGFDAPGAWIPGRVLDGRSAGIKDLRYGYTVDEEWQGRDPGALFEDGSLEVPLLEGVDWHFVAATVTRDAAHPVGRLVGDLLVRVESASGPRVARELPAARHLGAVLHHELQNHPAVYELLRDSCTTPAGP
ncbi:MAG: alpha/beta fold hydrolase [Polyangiales bacterium]